MPILKEIHPELAGKPPYELFKMYFDSDIMNLILEETLRYAMQNNNYIFSLSEKLLEVFLGNLLFSGSFLDSRGFILEQFRRLQSSFHTKCHE